MTGSDLNMTWTAFLKFYQRIATDVAKVSAYDYAKNIWIHTKDALSTDTTFRMVVLTMQDGFKIRIEIVPMSRHRFTINREAINSPHLWQRILQIPVTASELDLLQLLKQRLTSRANLPQIRKALEGLAAECQKLAAKLRR